MVYEIRRISSFSDLQQCHSFEISNFQWRSVYRPKANGSVGYLENEGFIVILSCEELHPTANYKYNFQPVYKDSALEAFFKFDTESPQYFNFEFNANGACIAAFGPSRHLRENFRPEQIRALKIKSVTTGNGWQIRFFIPESIIFAYQPQAGWKRKKRVSCNFYKLSEDPAIEHYGSMAPVNLPAPNFHNTDFFVKAKII